MITYKTLEDYMQKVVAIHKETELSLTAARDEVAQLEATLQTQLGQIITLKQLMNMEDNPPTVEMNIIDEETMKEEHGKRLGFFEGETPEGFFEERKDVTYKREAEDTAKKIDALNKNPE